MTRARHCITANRNAAELLESTPSCLKAVQICPRARPQQSAVLEPSGMPPNLQARATDEGPRCGPRAPWHHSGR
eukprot:1078294-Alexandrium_andersonii.AAC.1